MLSTDAILDVLMHAADRTASRHSAHVANIANADVPGYQRIQAEFLTLLDPAHAMEVAKTGPEGTEIGDPGQVRIDHEMALMAENAIRYQILLGAFDSTVGLMRSAVREGR